jgi:hypothetical protein
MRSWLRSAVDGDRQAYSSRSHALSRIIGIELGWVYYLLHRTEDTVTQIQVANSLALNA